MNVNFMAKYFNMNYKILIVPKGVVGLIAVQLYPLPKQGSILGGGKGGKNYM